MAELAAVVGIGQTKYRTKRSDVSMAGLVREAAMDALNDAGLGWDDIDAVIIGKAPDMFEGVIMPELYLTDALGCNGKPMLRVHTAGSVGGSTAIVAASYVQSGVFKRILTVTFEKQSESNAMWALSSPQPFSPHLNAGAGGYFAPIIREYMRRSEAPYDAGIKVAVKDRLHGAKNPLAHLQLPEITMKEVEDSPMLWDPLRFLEVCPSSDGACAMVIAHEDLVSESPKKPAWIKGQAMRSEPTMYAGREEVNPQAGRDCAADVYKQAGITNPLKDFDCAEVYVPFSWYEPMWLENLGFAEEGKGWELTMAGITDNNAGGSCPWNPSGGVLSSNAIGASGMIRFAEAARQVRNDAGDHQVEGAKTALGHAYGGGAQFFAMWVVSSEK
jgi:acetyl-CoA C-acetyltransferase